MLFTLLFNVSHFYIFICICEIFGGDEIIHTADLIAMWIIKLIN